MKFDPAMAGWISSKLKVAETLLQQIDQQAAESLGKTERPDPSSDALGEDIPKRIDPAPPLKHQLPSKRPSPPPPPLAEPSSAPRRSSSSSLSAVADDGDWTELLSSSKPIDLASPCSDGGSKKAAIPFLTPRKGIGRTYAIVAVRSRRRPEIVPREGEGSKSPKEDESSSSGLSYLDSKNNEHVGSIGGPEETPNVVDGNEGEKRQESGVMIRKREKAKSSSSGSDADSGSDTGSTTDSEDERQRREERRQRRVQMMAAAAAEAIKEREDIVAKLEGEMESLEKMLKEREKKQAQEASELQSNMIETMEAVEIEKQKHNSTRMEALARLAKIEVMNAELAKSLATAQWNLEIEVNRAADLREQIELKELAQAEFRRKTSKSQKSPPYQDEMESLRRFKLEQEILEAEYTFTCDKIMKMKDKAKKVEGNIVITRMDMVHPTEVEMELRKRLDQLTDRLIQKQMQVEALSSEKATLLLRMETASRLLDENPAFSVAGSSAKMDIEAGIPQPSNSPAPALRDRIRTGQQQLGSVVQQLDSIFSAGLIYLRRNPKAQLWSLFYLVCLHLWVLYILSSHSQVSEGSSTGAIISLESINKTASS
ncbi:golgin candidate 2 isoform X2 [Typha latifolia]|uniref:golgin candidate 2 isoform X2 n=1 Tax=Typha latifolia TaxID=4733 RepID=UPI003C2C48F5